MVVCIPLLCQWYRCCAWLTCAPRLLAEGMRMSILEASVRLQTFPIVAIMRHAAAAAVCLSIVFCW